MSTVEVTPASSAGAIFGISLNQIISLFLIVIIAVTIERCITKYLSHFSKRTKLEPNTANKLTLTFRILILIGALLAVSRVGGVSSELFLSVSAISGAALGFASQKTIGNFIAGLYLLTARPFKVGDYVKIGTVEGIAQEITLNYVKILTAGNSIVAISNLQMLDRDITNYFYQTTQTGNIYCYTFEIGFDHLIPTEKLLEIFETTFDTYNHFPKKPFCVLTRSTATERVYTVYFYVTQSNDIFTTRPQIANQIFNQWDKARANLKKQ
ncbi:MAG: mechanosensitive ion channel family protein [Nitrososphaerota archaeon]|jgi:small-conductance mechanosensitive channel|nr:mechanosensitive ion channel family protein [Nitrososphaerota archaeon]